MELVLLYCLFLQIQQYTITMLYRLQLREPQLHSGNKIPGWWLLVLKVLQLYLLLLQHGDFHSYWLTGLHKILQYLLLLLRELVQLLPAFASPLVPARAPLM